MLRSCVIERGRLGAAVAAVALACACTEPEGTSEIVADEPSSSGQGSEPAIDAIPDATAADLEITLLAERTYSAAADGAWVTVKVRNLTGRRVRVLDRDTVLRGIKSDVLVVLRGEAVVPYVGRHYKWAAPQASSYIVIDRGETVTATVDLATAYDFSVTSDYVVHALPYGIQRENDAPLHVVSTATLQAEGRPFAPQRVGGVRVAVTPTLSATGCDATQAAALPLAYAAARKLAAGALSYLRNTEPAGTARYVSWFGTFSPQGWAAAKEHFMLLTQHLANETADCSCKDNAYAYVYPTEPHRVYLCQAFWSAPVTGTDSRAGTLIHEMSHFVDVIGTEDWAYGQTAAKRLAKRWPARALSNADSHEYFAENTPFLQ